MFVYSAGSASVLTGVVTLYSSTPKFTNTGRDHQSVVSVTTTSNNIISNVAGSGRMILL